MKNNIKINQLSNFIGFKIKKINLYKKALTHKSVIKNNDDLINKSNERLEFLGDAVLSMVIAEYLYNKYPNIDEGELTSYRSKIVSRKSLNTIAIKTGLIHFISKIDNNNKNNIPGNALEALIGAIFLDKGLKATKNFIYKKIINTYYIQNLLNQVINFKSRIIEWAHANKHKVNFKTIINNEIFYASLFVNDKILTQGEGKSKKEAEQMASQKACKILFIDK